MRLDGRTPFWRMALALCAWVLVLVSASSASADDCVPARGRTCNSNTDCSGAAVACIGGTCQVPCGVVPAGMLDEVPQPNLCSLGETCAAVPSGAKQRYICKPTPFRMDLNGLDSCIYHFVEGLDPALGSGNQCSIIRQLTSFLDQNGDSSFDIYDVDLCIKSFLGDPPCDATAKTCPNSQQYCDTDATCGSGLFCNPDMHRCERECGFIVDRDDTNAGSLDRVCTGRLETCDYERGRCHDVSLDGASCQLDRDCPSGAYCFVGKCAPKCYRTLDCPDSTWFCNVDNTCRPKPKPSPDGDSFNPKDYSVVYATDAIQLDPFQNQYDVPILIMNQKTGKQVFSDPKVVFGYRLETKYERKNTATCNGDLTQLPQDVQEDCIIAPEEEFLTLANPFGTLFAEGDPSTSLRLNAAAADKLSPGFYPVVVTAYFNNGQSTSVRVTFKKPSPSGEYGGKLSSYLGGPDAHIATTNVAMRLFIKTPEEDPSAVVTTWEALLAANNLDLEQEYRDITEGYSVSGYIHAGQSLVFDKPDAAAKADNEIPVAGLYSPKLGRLRLIAVLNLPKALCRNSAGLPCTGATGEWQANNPFGRDIRRIVEFIGPFRAAEQIFEGMYRETIEGLSTSTFTLDGGFRMTQLSQDTRPVVLGAPLLAATAKNPVTFPATDSVTADLATQLSQVCPTIAATVGSQAGVNAYLANYGTAQPTFPSVVFEKRIRDAMNSLSPATKGAATLTFTEFLAGQITFCSSTVTTNCVDKNQLACGLAFTRLAALKGWFNRTALGKDANGLDVSPPLFCTRSTDPSTNTCSPVVLPNPNDPTQPYTTGAVMYQDHGRFYRELEQAYVYQANSAWNDAFYALYKAADQANPFGTAGSFAYKEGKLRDVIKNYDAARAEMLGTAAAATMFSWPMNRFQGLGDPWLHQMQTVMNDRLDAWVQFADLERRIMQTANLDTLFTFSKHLVSQDYLAQVYLAELQRNWQGLSFHYAGEAADVLAKGDVLLAKLSDSRNPLGLSPDRVYFENSNLALTNWQNYKAQLDQRLPASKNVIQQAVANLHQSLDAKSTVETKLMQTQQGRDASLDDICGPVTVDDPKCRVDPEDKKLQTSCVGSSCPYQWSCDKSDEDGRCATVVKMFSTAVDTVSCRSDIDANQYLVDLGKDSGGAPITRSCNHGRVGALLQERVKTDLERKEAKRQVQSLLRQIAREQQELAATRASNADIVQYLSDQRTKFAEAETAIAVADGIFQQAQFAAEGVKCMVIVGLADGTDCPQSAVATGIKIAALAAKDIVVPGLQLAMSDMSRAKEIRFQEKSGDAQVRQLQLELDNLVAQVENIIGQYKLQTQQLYNLDMQIGDNVKLAQNVADRYREQTQDIVNRLVGADSGQSLRANEMIRASDKEFQDLLVIAYKMTRAFLHRYNYADTAEVWTNRVYSLITVPDIEKLEADLVAAEQNYCGAQGIDCDSINNRQVFRFSVRDQLFPNLKDIVDPSTGKVLYAGMQFHNLITSSAYRQRRVVQGTTIEQIEIPFAIWAQDLGTNGSAPKPLMLPRGECNHMIVADRSGNNGTFAVGVAGTRVDGSSRIVKYQLYRGGTDDLRSCDASGISINRYHVGSPVIESSVQQFFQTKTQQLAACMNSDGNLESPALRDQSGPCWNYFARDRSLAAPDYILVIPLENQKWIVGIDDATGAPIPDANKPIIEDIRMYFRYNARAAN